MADSNINKTFSKHSIEKLFDKNELPDSWDASRCKVAYNMLTEIYFIMEQQSISWTFFISVLNLFQARI